MGMGNRSPKTTHEKPVRKDAKDARPMLKGFAIAEKFLARKKQ